MKLQTVLGFGFGVSGLGVQGRGIGFRLKRFTRPTGAGHVLQTFGFRV